MELLNLNSEHTYTRSIGRCSCCACVCVTLTIYTYTTANIIAAHWLLYREKYTLIESYWPRTLRISIKTILFPFFLLSKLRHRAGNIWVLGLSQNDSRTFITWTNNKEINKNYFETLHEFKNCQLCWCAQTHAYATKTWVWNVRFLISSTPAAQFGLAFGSRIFEALIAASSSILFSQKTGCMRTTVRYEN